MDVFGEPFSGDAVFLQVSAARDAADAGDDDCGIEHASTLTGQADMSWAHGG
jgi:hypothetical protein